MLKKLAVPLFSLAIATFGCSSSTTPTTGSGGSSATGGSSGGGGGKTGGTGGTSATGGTTGSGGASATGGAGGAAATGGAGGAKATGGAGGATATGGAGGAKATGGTGGAGGALATTDAGRMADCSVVDPGGTGTDTLTAAVFCAQMAAYCPSQFTTESACETTYTQSGQEHCRSYHMCWGVEGITNTSANPTVHCPHTIGIGLCQATTDAASGN